jgi:hypothetical protein
MNNDVGSGRHQVGIALGAAAVGHSQGILQADPHVIAVGQGILEYRPGCGIVAVLDTRKMDPAALQDSADHGGGSNRIGGPRLDLDEDPQATLDEAAVDEGAGVGNRAETSLDRDAPCDE